MEGAKQSWRDPAGARPFLLHLLTTAFGPKRPFAAVQNYVRFLGYSGREMLAVSLSHFDPQRTLATNHSITSSAVASSVGGTVRPSILAVSALMTSSNFDACTTGRSAGLALLRMRPA